MAISRTKVNALINDDGSGTVGTLFAKQNMVDVYDDVDAFVTNWTTFVPTWTNLSVGNGTPQAKWARVNKVILVDLLVVFGTTTTVSGAVSVTSLPASNPAFAAAYRLGHLAALDVSAGQYYAGVVLSTGATSAALFFNASPLTAMSVAAPFTWANTDQLHLSLCYQEP